MNQSKLAIIFTCFNRREKTKRCIHSLLAQKNIIPFDLFVCDDGSTDGTKEAIKEIIPQAYILHGTGNLFWSKGMYVAMKEAVARGYDYYLMVNDDVEFLPSMWEVMFAPYKDGFKAVAVVGTTKSKYSDVTTYGGRKRICQNKRYFESSVILPNRANYERCDVANWNCFLIDAQIQKKVGLIDPRYAHGLGDYDYSLRIGNEGYEIFVAKSYVGYCENNGKKNTYKDASLPALKRFRLMQRPNGFPAQSWMLYVWKNCPKGKLQNIFSPLIKDYLKILMGKEI